MNNNSCATALEFLVLDARMSLSVFHDFLRLPAWHLSVPLSCTPVTCQLSTFLLLLSRIQVTTVKRRQEEESYSTLHHGPVIMCPYQNCVIEAGRHF